MTEALLTEQKSHCMLCGSMGRPSYEGLQDRLFGAPGTWALVRCPDPSCGLFWLNPMPLAEELSKAYRNYYTHDVPLPRTGWRRLYEGAKDGYRAIRYGYGKGSVRGLDCLLGLVLFLLPSRRSHLDFAFHELCALPRGHLLEIGCGNGELLERMQRWGWRVEGLEIDPIAARRAQDKGLTVHSVDLHTASFPDDSFDAIVSSHGLEHVYDPLSMLRDCRRVLKSRGRLVLATPNLDSWGHRTYLGSWRGLEPPRHLHLFTPQALLTALAKAGFQMVQWQTTIRGAKDIFRASGLGPWGAEFREFVEWIYLHVNPGAGEELIVIAVK